MTFVAMPLIVGGLVMKPFDDDFRELRNDHARSFDYHYNDYVQYLPMATMFGMKAFGVRSRSSWGRMLVSDAFSAALMATAVNSLKYSCKVMRPDGSTRNSFPSGHTATAFMAATMLHKEYGHLSPWVSVGGYTVATLTGVSRQLNNRHWVSDVMVGAGIGILATELGYFFADLIYKRRGLNVEETMLVYDRYRCPSFLSFSLGLSTMPGSYRLGPSTRVELMSGPSVGVGGGVVPHTLLGHRRTFLVVVSARERQQCLADREPQVRLGQRRTLPLLPLLGAVAPGVEASGRLRGLQELQHRYDPPGGLRRIPARNGRVGYLPCLAELRRALPARLRHGAADGALVARTAASGDAGPCRGGRLLRRGPADSAAPPQRRFLKTNRVPKLLPVFGDSAVSCGCCVADYFRVSLNFSSLTSSKGSPALAPSPS